MYKNRKISTRYSKLKDFDIVQKTNIYLGTITTYLISQG